MLNRLELPRKISANREELDPTETNNITVSERDFTILTDFSSALEDVLGKDELYKVALIGGTGLRLLEKITGLGTLDIFSGYDIDAFYCDTDEAKFREVKQAISGLSGLPPVDVYRFLREDEARKPIQQKFVQDDEGNLSSSMLRGRIQHGVAAPLDIIGVPLDNGHEIFTISPAISFHMYAIRSIGGVKQKDWDDKKHRRLLEVNQRLNSDSFGMNMRGPKDYPEFRQARQLARQG